MAGIGFVLRKLARHDDLLGIVQGFAHSAIASNGPWLLTILGLGTLSVLGAGNQTLAGLNEFRLIIIYNFAFSLLLTGPLLMVITRMVADLIYEKRVETAPGALLGGLGVVMVTQAPLVIAFYTLYADLPVLTRIAAIGNFLLVSGLWLASVFLSALKDYRSVSGAFGAGMLVAIAAGALLAHDALPGALVFGFNLGLAVTLFALIAKILAEYPYPPRAVWAFLGRFRVYRTLAWSGFIYNAAIWIDKWIMWLSARGETAPSGLISYPHYDSAMFLAYLTIVPALAMFMVTVETRFFEGYLTFYRDLQRHASYARIRRNHQALISILVGGVRNLVVIQGSFSVLVVLTAPALFAWLGIDFLEIGIFRLGVLGAFFHVLVLVLLVVLAYFDFRAPALALQVVFLVTNALFTVLSLRLGFAWYGYGYFLAALSTFVAAYLVTYHYLGALPYQSFVRHNQAIRAGRVRSRVERVAPGAARG